MAGLFLAGGGILIRRLVRAAGADPDQAPPRSGSRRPGYGYLLVTLVYALVAVLWLGWAVRLNVEPFAWFSGVSIWPSEIVRLTAGWVASMLLIYGWRRLVEAEDRIAEDFELEVDAGDGEPVGFLSGRGGSPAEPTPADTPRAGGIARQVCNLFAGGRPPRETGGNLLPASRMWRDYRARSRLWARLGRVLPAAALFWLFAFVIVYGFFEPISPHRGEAAYWFSTLNGLILVGLPFTVLLFAAVDEALLCSGLLQRLHGARIDWPVDTHRAGCALDEQSRRAVTHWITTRFIAARTAPSATVIHLPFIVMLFLLLSLSTRFDNWNTPVSVVALIALSVAIGLLASMRLRRTARQIRDQVLEQLKEEVTGIEYAAAQSRSEKLRRLVERIEAIHNGAYARWYNEPVFRALAWVLGIGIFIVTEYTRIG
jgi:hypothetical protein